MLANSGFRGGSATAEGLLRLKLEYVVLTLVLHYGGSYEDSFLEWYSAVKLAVPELSGPQVLRDVFHRLTKQGIIELRSPAAGTYKGNAQPDFLLDTPFITILTPEGLI